MTTLLHYIQSIYIRFCYFFGKKASRPVSEMNCIDDDLYIDYTISQCFQHDCEAQQPSQLHIEYNELFHIEEEIEFLNEVLFDEVFKIENLPEPAFTHRNMMIQYKDEISSLMFSLSEIASNDEQADIIYQYLTESIQRKCSYIDELSESIGRFIDRLDINQLPDALIELQNSIINTRTCIAKKNERRTLIRNYLNSQQEAEALQL